MDGVLEYLHSKGVRTKSAGSHNVHTACFFCNEPDNKRGRLYINIDDNAEILGLFMCHLCSERGSLNKIKRHFGDPVDLPDKVSENRLRILEAAALYYKACLPGKIDVLDYLKTTRGLTDKAIDDFSLGWGGRGLLNHLVGQGFEIEDVKKTGLIVGDKNHEFLEGRIVIPYINSGNVTQLRGRAWGESKAKYVTPPGQPTKIYNLDAVWRRGDADDKREICIVEGEFDCIVMSQLGYRCVGIPGASAWQESWGDYFTEFKRVFVIFDNDAAGIGGGIKIAEALGGKSRRVSLPEGSGDISEYIIEQGHTRQHLDDILKASSGSILVSVREAFQEWEWLQSQAGLKFGIPLLDWAIAPGLLPGQLMIPLAKSGVGKGHPLDTIIQTPSGTRMWGDLQVGDHVFGSNGSPTRVAAIHDRGVLPTWKVHFSDKSSTVVDGDHLWSVTSRYGHVRAWCKNEALSTVELLERGLRRGPEWRYQIPMAPPVAYPEKSLPIEPYTLGSLIANGYLCGSSAVLTTPDGDVIERISKHYKCVQSKPFGVCPHYCIHELIDKVKDLGLNVLSKEKFIPREYLEASVEQRISLLQGLMDGDGSYRANQNRSSVSYFSGSRQLVADVKELVNSLGGTAVDSWFRQGTEGKVSIMLPPEVKPFGTVRKSQTRNVANVTKPHRSIVAIEPLDEAPIRCITVEAEDSLYLTNNYIVTHNSISLLNLMHGVSVEQPKAKMLLLSLEQTRGDWFERARRIQGFHNPHLAPRREDDIPRFRQDIHASTVNYWSDRLMISDKNRISEEEVLASIEDFEERMGQKPDLVCVDYLGYWANSYKAKDKYEQVSKAVMGLKAIAKSTRIPFISPGQLNRTAGQGDEPDIDQARDSGVIVETADFVMAMWMADTGSTDADERTGNFALRLGKSRHGNKGTLLNLQFGYLSLALVPIESTNAIFTRKEVEYQLERRTWEYALMKHAGG